MRLILTIATTLSLVYVLHAQPVSVMLITGGHAYDTVQFFQLFDSLEGINYEHFTQPAANRKLTEGYGNRFDVLVFYDMCRRISEQEKQAYTDLTRNGKSLLFLHHALVSYQDWPEFEQLIGGRYVEKSADIPAEQQSTYRHDVWVDIAVVDQQHPVTRGFDDFRLFDEVYGNFRVSPRVKPLLKTSHPESTSWIGWENRYNNSTVIYLQSGHDRYAFESTEYRRLISNSIKYLKLQTNAN